jgi:hypothetical protein
VGRSLRYSGADELVYARVTGGGSDTVFRSSLEHSAARLQRIVTNAAPPGSVDRCLAFGPPVALAPTISESPQSS